MMAQSEELKLTSSEIFSTWNTRQLTSVYTSTIRRQNLSARPQMVASLLQAAPNLCRVNPDDILLLGSPIGELNSINTAITSQLHALKTMSSRLHHFHKQNALLLLRQSFAVPKLLYILGTAPCCFSPMLATFDQELRSILANILIVSLDNPPTWLQATLFIKFGGLVIRRATQLAPSTFLASGAGCKDLSNQILPDRLKFYG